MVTEVADAYCSGLAETGVRCTLKHFPGLGRVFEDTHREDAGLAGAVDELSETDWVPFRTLMRHANAFTMLGHARLIAVDRDRPVSFSEPVVGGTLRGEWKHEGVLITDDFGMGAVYRSRDGIAGASVEALNAGVDLILISFDPDQYYPAMYALLKAERAGRLRPAVLQQSDLRLSTAEPSTKP